MCLQYAYAAITIFKWATENIYISFTGTTLYQTDKAHLSLTLTEWARQWNVIVFVLPPHTSQLTQPLDVGVFGSFKSQYNKECQAHLQK